MVSAAGPKHKVFTSCLAATAFAAATALAPSGLFAAAPEKIRRATWNLEWFMTPQIFKTLAPYCRKEHQDVYGGERALPCDVVRNKARRPEDYARLRYYAQQLDADVIALQEVDGPEAAALVLPNYDFCFTARRNLQNNGIAIRRGRGIRFRCDADVRGLGLARGRLRYGAAVTLFPGTSAEMHLLDVHLKSGCALQPLYKAEDSCRLLSRQVPVLESWIDNAAKQGQRFVVFGDFNRRLSKEGREARDRLGRPMALWPEINDGDPPGAALSDATAGSRYIKCHRRESYDSYIDHIVAGALAARHLDMTTVRRTTYTEPDVHNFKLSDHCPLSVEYHLAP
jgi:endonuclease/exonuclease/phosphatase family metal-dependent hydrolase